MKTRGWALMRNGQLLHGAELVLEAWHARSLEAAISNGTWRAHPVFDVYVAALDLEKHLGVAAVELRRKQGNLGTMRYEDELARVRCRAVRMASSF